MKTIARGLFLVLILACTFSAGARPIEFREVSLLVRAHDAPADILQTVGTRKLIQRLTPSQEKILQSQGADASLIRGLRDPDLILSPAEAAVVATEEEAGRNRAAAADREADSSGQNIRVFDVSYGHPINLSQWGGPSREIAFQLRRCGVEEIVEPIIGGSFTSVATYLGQGRPDDSTTLFDRRDYVSAISYDRSRVGSIDLRNPITIKGTPYLLYPVYGAGGVSLYFIGKDGDSVRVAVVIEKA